MLAGLAVHPLLPGRDICVNSNVLVMPVQAKIFDCAIEMKNIIYVVADMETRQCVVIDAVSVISKGFVNVHHHRSIF